MHFAGQLARQIEKSVRSFKTPVFNAYPEIYEHLCPTNLKGVVTAKKQLQTPAMETIVHDYHVLGGDITREARRHDDEYLSLDKFITSDIGSLGRKENWYPKMPSIMKLGPNLNFRLNSPSEVHSTIPKQRSEKDKPTPREARRTRSRKKRIACIWAIFVLLSAITFLIVGLMARKSSQGT